MEIEPETSCTTVAYTTSARQYMKVVKIWPVVKYNIRLTEGVKQQIHASSQMGGPVISISFVTLYRVSEITGARTLFLERQADFFESSGPNSEGRITFFDFWFSGVHAYR